MIRPTRTGWGLLLVGALLYLASFTSQASLLLSVMSLLAGCLVANALAARRSVRSVDVRPPPTTVLAEGQRVSQPWEVANHGREAAHCLALRSAAGSLFRLAAVGPGQSLLVVPDLAFAKRGVFRYDAARLTCEEPFGLVAVARRLVVAGEVVVCPAVYHTEPPPAAGYDLMVGGRHKGTRRTTSGTQFAGVRPLRPGDPLRQVHWKSSAKGRGLMVKVYDEELSGRVTVVLDGGACGVAATFDDAVRCAGSLMFAALDAGHHVEWVDAGQMIPRIVPPFADVQELLEDLARLEMQPPAARSATGCAVALRRAVDMGSSRSAVSLVLTVFDDATAEFVAELQTAGRQVAVYLPAAAATLPTGPGLAVSRYSATAVAAAGAPAASTESG